MNDPSAIVWEECACDICGRADSQPVFQGPDRLEGLPGEFFMARCPDCGTYRQNPRPAWQSLQQFYPEDYASHPPLVQDEPTWLRRLDKRYGPWKRVRAVERHIQKGDLLESKISYRIYYCLTSVPKKQDLYSSLRCHPEETNSANGAVIVRIPVDS